MELRKIIRPLKQGQQHFVRAQKSVGGRELVKRRRSV